MRPFFQRRNDATPPTTPTEDAFPTAALAPAASTAPSEKFRSELRDAMLRQYRRADLAASPKRDLDEPATGPQPAVIVDGRDSRVVMADMEGVDNNTARMHSEQLTRIAQAAAAARRR